MSLRDVQRNAATNNAILAIEEIDFRMHRMAALLREDPATAANLASEIVPFAIQIVKCAGTLFWLSEMAKK